MQGLLICVGKLKEKYLRQAADEYKKRLGRFVQVEEAELPDLPEPQGGGDALVRQVLDREGEAILQRIRPADYVIALCVEGKQYTSEDFARHMARWKGDGRRMVFVIGGSLGLSRGVKERADEKLSLSAMTFPHQLARVLLLEQWYRAEKINANERYHK